VRIAYALRAIRAALTDEASAYVAAMAAMLATAGAQVRVLTETPIEELTALLPAGAEVVQPDPAPPDRWYLSPLHQYADRVATTTARLAATGLDVAELPVAGGEAFTAVRTRRLIGAPTGTAVVARLHGPPEGVDMVPVSFEDDIHAFAESYAIRHADAVAAPARELLVGGRGPTAAWPAPLPLTAAPEPAPRISGPVRRVLFLGELSPRGGLVRFLAAAEQIVQRDASFWFEIYGHDTLTDPFGRSYQAWMAKRLTPPLAGRVSFHDPPSVDDLGALLGAPAMCVFTDARQSATSALHAAMLSGAVVVAQQGLETCLDECCALLVDVADAAAVAQAVLERADRVAVLRNLTGRAREVAERRCDPDAVRVAAESLYEWAMRAASTSGDDGGERRAAGRQGRARPARVSFVVPLFNQGEYVQAAIGSALSSDYPNVEVVVVDDGSTDPATRQVFDELRGVVKVRQENRGLAAARNAGIAASSGTLILPLDADDLVDPAYAGLAARSLERSPDLVYVTSYARNFGLFEGGFAPVGNVLTLMPFLHTDGRCASLYRRSALEQVGGYDEDLLAYEDWDLQIRLGKAGLAGDVLPSELFFYRRHRASLVFRHSNANRVELLQYLMRRHADLLAPQGLELALKLVHLWRTGFESSESMRFLAAEVSARAGSCSADRG
jgi:GT2 family glycosyltransferase/glycosyltransferase involved in cell wall biosynthesis